MFKYLWNANLMKLSLLAIIPGFLFACNTSKDHPGYTYFPDMTYSQAYETYSENPNYNNDMTNRRPVEGSIPRGYMPFHYANTPEDYERAGVELVNPIENSAENIAKGKYNFEIYCAICHGKSGEGNGPIVKSEKFPAVPPSYFKEPLISLPDGKMFFSIQYGKNMMGSYASQLSQSERWMIIRYIRFMQEQKLGTDVVNNATN